MWRADLRMKYIDGRLVELTAPLHYKPTGCWLVIVPEGFVTDFATIPRLFWRIAPPMGDGPGAMYGPAAVLHDWLYQHPEGRTRKEVDDLFLAAMTDLGVSWWRRWGMHKCVRAFGWVAWRRYRNV